MLKENGVLSSKQTEGMGKVLASYGLFSPAGLV